jgi:hypothetical protein
MKLRLTTGKQVVTVAVILGYLMGAIVVTSLSAIKVHLPGGLARSVADVFRTTGTHQSTPVLATVARAQPEMGPNSRPSPPVATVDAVLTSSAKQVQRGTPLPAVAIVDALQTSSAQEIQSRTPVPAVATVDAHLTSSAQESQIQRPALTTPDTLAATPASAPASELTPATAATENAATPSAGHVGNTGGAGAYLRPTPQHTVRGLLLPDGTPLSLVGIQVVSEGDTWQEVMAAGNAGWIQGRYVVP